MKAQEFLTEAPKKPAKSAPSERTPVSKIDYAAMAQQVVEYMRANAKPWLAQTKNGALMVYRGIADDSVTAHAFTQNIRQDRRPKDTDQERHQAFNKVIAAAGGVANRSNAAFVSGHKDQAESYGRPYVFVPLGDFRYTWSPEYADWTQDFETYDLLELAISVNPKKDPRAQAYVRQEILLIVKAAEQTLRKTKDPEVKAYYAKRIADLQNPKSELYKDFVDNALSVYREEIIGEVENAEYDPKKAKRVVYADRDLARGIKSGYEIMLNSTMGLYIDDEFYEEAVLPLLQGRGTKLESFDQTDSIDVTEGVADPDIFKAVFLVGGPGSGKTSISQKLLGHTGLRRVDVDAFYTMLKSKADVAGQYEPEFYKRAGALAGRRQDLFLKGRLGMIFDSTGRKTQRILTTKAQLEALGYDTMLIYVKTDLRTALSRNELRTRKVEPQEVAQMHQEVQQNIGTLKQAFGKDMLEVDNTLVPDLNQAAARVDMFLSKPPSKPQAREWIGKNR